MKIGNGGFLRKLPTRKIQSGTKRENEGSGPEGQGGFKGEV